MREQRTGSETGRTLRLPAGGVELIGDLVVPAAPAGIVLFAHGSGSGRFSPRNRQVAKALNDAGLATLLADLLTEREDQEDRSSARFRFDITWLAARVAGLVDGVSGLPETENLPIGLFGASTGAAAALIAAAERPDAVQAVVSRGGRPDLAGEALAQVQAATLLIVGGNDPEVLALNRQAAAHLRCEQRLVVVPDASHLFEEAGALERVAELAADWFKGHLRAAGTAGIRRTRS